MLALLELQRAFRSALLGGGSAAIASLVLEDGLPPALRLDVHRNNVRASLCAALADAFPAVRRLVDARFFDYAAESFLRSEPPEGPCLHEYGARFPDFLAAFPPCRELVYLPDVARLEWLLHLAAYAEEAPALAPSALSAITGERAPELRLRLHPSLGLMTSPFPIDRIWDANRSGAGSDEAIDLDVGAVHLEVGRSRGALMLRVVDAACFAFLRMLRMGATLEAAAAAALAHDADFDLAAELASLFASELVVGYST